MHAAVTTFSLRYDLRAPAHLGVDAKAQYAACLEQCQWAERVGFAAVTLSEHHTSDDGYLPSPLVMGAAILGRTDRLFLMVAALLAPLYDPIRLAEDLAVLDLASGGGRVGIVLGAGYRREEFELFGRDLKERPQLLEEAIVTLQQAWTGEAFEFRGRTVRVTPKPVSPPMLMLGGSTKAAARRAVRLGLPFLPTLPELTDYYRDLLAEQGHELPPPSSNGPLFLHVAEDPDEAWAKIAPYALHETNSYGSWLAAAPDAPGPYAAMDTADGLRGTSHHVVTPEECVELVRSLGPNGSLTLHPLMGGIPPDLAWSSLELVESRVLPNLD
jgi:alkanesulfonate monooxygenase SsuD/methylene tetrahydromethanopterin reductase-like flavin-dependent oxidoreductase (luciferase family)